MTYDEAVHFLIYDDPGPGPVWLAEKLGIKSQAVTGWFQKGKKVSKIRDLDIANAFGVDFAALRKGQIKAVSSPLGGIEINAKIISDLLNKPENARFF